MGIVTGTDRRRSHQKGTTWDEACGLFRGLWGKVGDQTHMQISAPRLLTKTNARKLWWSRD